MLCSCSEHLKDLHEKESLTDVNVLTPGCSLHCLQTNNAPETMLAGLGIDAVQLY